MEVDDQKEEKKQLVVAELKPISKNLPPFYQWLRQRGLVKPKGTKPYTHLATCARLGPIVVPDDMLAPFNENYVKDWKSEIPLFISEEAAELHILFFDLDFTLAAETKYNPILGVEKLGDLFHGVVSAWDNSLYSAVDPDQRRFIPSAVPSTPVEKDGNVMLKCGLHFFWPDIYVRKETHRAIRSVVLGVWRERMPTNELAEGVVFTQSPNKIVDVDVIMKPKLRMFGSSKSDFCDCKKKNVECPHLRGRGDAGRLYRVMGLRDADNDEMDIPFMRARRDPLFLLQLTSLRRRPPEGEDETPVALPENIQQLMDTDAAEDAAAHSQHGLAGDAKERGAKGLVQGKDREYDVIREILRLVCNIDQITSIQLHKKGKTYTVQTPSRACFNRGGNHHSNSSYVKVSLLFVGCVGVFVHTRTQSPCRSILREHRR